MSTARRRGFTFIELAICLAIFTILGALWYSWSQPTTDVGWQVSVTRDASDTFGTVSESLRRDATAADTIILQDGALVFGSQADAPRWERDGARLIRRQGDAMPRVLTSDLDRYTPTVEQGRLVEIELGLVYRNGASVRRVNRRIGGAATWVEVTP